MASLPACALKVAASWLGASVVVGRSSEIQELHVVVPVVLEVPVGIGGEPVVAIAVENNGVIVRDSVLTEELTEGIRA